MPNCPEDKTRHRRFRQLIAQRTEAADGDERGAVLLLCLAAILILMLMGWVMLDAIFVTVDKGNAQQSADTAAFSQASAQARSMNMLAFTNVAKRSLIGVHTVYESMFTAYEDWVHWMAMECAAQSPRCDEEKLARNLELYGKELETDYSAYQDNLPYYYADLRALDNYQQHIADVAPWWSFSEAVLRAQRNGATLATSFPPPPGYAPSDAPRVLDDVVHETGGDSSLAYNVSSAVGRLPVSRADYQEGMVQAGMLERRVFADPEGGEHSMNVREHRSRSERAAADWEVITRGGSMGRGGLMRRRLENAHENIQRWGAPWLLNRYDEEANWLLDTSQIAITYHNEPRYFEGMADKFDLVGGELDSTPSSSGDDHYRTRGTWGMSRAEISFQTAEQDDDAHPDMWRPSWTARMRPVVFPGELRQAGIDFNAIYHSSIEHLMLSGRMHATAPDDPGEFMEDLVYFEKVSRALGQNSAEGMGR